MSDRLAAASRFLSYVLRHRPDSIGLELDGEGWASIDDLIARSQATATPLTRERIEAVVRANDKQRFRIDDTGRRIRASQGHSVAVDLALPPSEPPELLFHGTAARHLAAIALEGLRPGTRRHVHLSADSATAARVGARHGSPVVLTVRAGELHRSGGTFYRADNGVWLVAAVPPRFLDEPPP